MGYLIPPMICKVTIRYLLNSRQFLMNDEIVCTFITPPFLFWPHFEDYQDDMIDTRPIEAFKMQKRE